ncbi:MAG: hypothetical protein WBM91_16710 [Eudoraea sp.]|uniref:hypothetical protein n=1 Tax=Eudoraea sp. TaxID=1979955 RepID=UPI003C750948
MKIIKQLSVLFLVINLFNACTKKETSYALQEISAPTAVSAEFNIAQDESGEVSVTPSAVGASAFEVYFGDVENETPTPLALGETAVHVYAEGEFTLRVVAVGLSGLTSELSRIVTISFAAPTDLETGISVSATNPLEITVTPTATNATVFDIYYGDVENEEPTTIMAGESAVHVYAQAGDYTVRVVARGAGAASIEASEVVTLEDSTLTLAESFPIDFESNETLSGVFEEGDGVTGGPIANPDVSGINTSATVFEFNKAAGAAWYSGLFHIFPQDIDLNASQEFTIKIWSPKAGINVRFQLEKEGGGGGPTVTVDQTLATANEWVSLTYDFSSLVNVGDAYDKFVIFPDFDDVGQPAGDGSVYYVDDVIQGSGSPEVATSFPISFEMNETLSGVFEDSQGVTGAPVANPDQSGINVSSTVFEFNKAAGAAWYSGLFQIFPADYDISTTQQFTFKIWSPKAGINVRFQIEKEGGGGGPTVFIDQTLATANEWVSLTYDFSGLVNVADAYDKFVIFPDFDDVGQPAGDGSVYYVDDIQQGVPPPTVATSFPIGFEMNETLTGVFEDSQGVTGVPIANPDQTGINTSATVFEFNKAAGAAWYSGMFQIFPADMDISTSQSFTIKIWSPKAGINVRFQIEKEGGGGGPTVFIDQTLATENEWVSLTYDFSGLVNAADAYDKFVIFPEFDDVGQPAGDGSIYYIDDITQD